MKSLNTMNHCIALTKNGILCKNRAKYNDGYCGIHVRKLDDACVICMSNLYDIQMLCCGHHFHKRCISKWLSYKHNCPICRCIIFDEEIELTRTTDNVAIQMSVSFS